MEVGEVGLMKYSMNNIDERARKILGFDKEEELEYDEVVDRYHLTGWILSNKYYFLANEEVSKRMEENERYDLLVKTANLVMERFIQNGKADEANKEGATLYVVANAIYDFEKSLDDIDTKTFS